MDRSKISTSTVIELKQGDEVADVNIKLQSLEERFEAEDAKQMVELRPCQRMKDYLLRLNP